MTRVLSNEEDFNRGDAEARSPRGRPSLPSPRPSPVGREREFSFPATLRLGVSAVGFAPDFFAMLKSVRGKFISVNLRSRVWHGSRFTSSDFQPPSPNAEKEFMTCSLLKNAIESLQELMKVGVSAHGGGKARGKV
jgi:hypothetical protein